VAERPALGGGARPPQPDEDREVLDGWDVATVVAEFEVADREQSVELADLLFEAEDVFTVRVGGVGERSVYRVDVPRGVPEARALGAEPGRQAAQELGIALSFVRIGISRDGLGDPEGESPERDVLPWAARSRRPSLSDGSTPAHPRDRTRGRGRQQTGE